MWAYREGSGVVRSICADVTSVTVTVACGVHLAGTLASVSRGFSRFLDAERARCRMLVVPEQIEFSAPGRFLSAPEKRGVFSVMCLCQFA